MRLKAFSLNTQELITASRLRPLSPAPSSPPKDEYGAGRKLDPIATPYKDDPDSARQYGDDPGTEPFDSAEVLESQRLMMHGVLTPS